MAAIRLAFSAALSRPTVMLVLGAGNALVFTLFYYWLGLADSSAAQVALSTVVIVAAFSLWLIVQGGAMAAFHDGGLQPSAGSAFAGAAARLPRLWLVALPWIAVLLVATWAASGQSTDVVASAPPGGTAPAKAAAFNLGAVLLPLVLALTAALFLPLLSQASSRVYTMRQVRHVFGQASYWIGWLLFVVAGLAVPVWLVRTVVPASSLAMQTVSMGFRFMLAYVLYLVSTLMLSALIARLAAEASQPAPLAAPAARA